MDKRIKKLVLTALFSAMSVLLYLFPKFSLPFFPSFLEMNFSMLPLMILGFACGAMYGGVGVLLRFASNLIIEGSITAGVGENNANIRHDVLNKLKVLGIKVDEELNQNAKGESLITTSDSKIKAYVIPTDEEVMIARDTYSFAK